jgi:plastocyanin
VFRPARSPFARITAVVSVLVLTTIGVVLVESSAHAATHSVSLKNTQFNPGTLNVAVGDTVTWTNDETTDLTHSVTGGVLASDDLHPGGKYEFTFGAVGTYAYKCRFHPDMVGQVVVGAGSTTGAPPASSPNPSPTVAPQPNASPVPAVGKDLGDGTRLATYEMVDGWKQFRLVAAPIQWETKPGVVKTAWAFNGIVPGPVIRVNEGDKLRVIVTNNLPPGEMTAIHWHGMELPINMDGVPGVSQPPIEVGQSFTYEFPAISAGTHWYHTHHGGEQLGRGMYGALEIVPRTGEIPADRDYRIMIGDGALGFVFNGKSFPATAPLKARVGERVHIRLIGTGPEMIHPIHLHGGFFQLVAQDGRRLPFPVEMDTLNVGVGQTYDIIFVPKKPGAWMLHCHIFSHSEVGHSMSGLVSFLQVDPPAVPLPLISLPGLPPLLPGLLGG